MAREIKFRAWHRGYVESPIRKQASPAMIYTIKASDALRWLEEGQPVEIMQFTGLPDKDGDEIYEGDIIKDKNGVIYFVEFKMCAFYKNNKLTDSLLFDSAGWLEIEVIGNIHQNPELL